MLFDKSLSIYSMSRTSAFYWIHEDDASNSLRWNCHC